MNEMRHNPVNRCFSGNCPKKQQGTQQKKVLTPIPSRTTGKAGEEKIKELLVSAVERRRANREIDCLLRQFHGRRSIFDLLPAMKQRGFPLYVLKVAIERVENRRNALKIEEVAELEAFKASLAEPKGG